MHTHCKVSKQLTLSEIKCSYDQKPAEYPLHLIERRVISQTCKAKQAAILTSIEASERTRNFRSELLPCHTRVIFFNYQVHLEEKIKETIPGLHDKVFYRNITLNRNNESAADRRANRSIETKRMSESLNKQGNGINETTAMIHAKAFLQHSSAPAQLWDFLLHLISIYILCVSLRHGVRYKYITISTLTILN